MSKNRNAVEEFEVGRCKCRIELDPEPYDPRKENENVGVMVCWHRRYNLGDEQPKNEDGVEYLLRLARQSSLDFATYDERILDIQNRANDRWYSKLEKARGKRRNEVLAKHYVILPLGLYDHSGITMYIGGRHAFDSAGWDSGQVGFIYCSLEKALYEWGTKGQEHLGWDGEANYTLAPDGTKRTLRQAAELYLTGEVEEYDQYLTGQVYGYVVEAEDGEEDSCYGYFGEIEYVRGEARSSAERQNERMTKEDAEAAEMACRDIATV